MAEEPTANQPPTHSLPGASRTPDGYDVLILDAGTRQSLASARSLGRAGLRVALAECFAECDPALPVLAFRSRYCARSVVLPSFATDAPGFSAAIIEFVRAHPTRVIMPASDGAIAALMPWRGRLAALGCQLALAPNAVLEVANSKARILEVAHGLGVEGPRSVRVDQPAQLAAALAGIGLPCVLKPAVGWPDGAPARLQATEVTSETEAHRRPAGSWPRAPRCWSRNCSAAAARESRCLFRTMTCGPVSRIPSTGPARPWAALPCCGKASRCRATSSTRRCAW